MKAILRAQDGKTVYQIRNAVTTVGRDGSDINLQQPNTEKQHAIIEYDDLQSCFVLQDLNSAHGTYVNECRVQNAAVRLAPGDQIRFGHGTDNYEFQVDQGTTLNCPPLVQIQPWGTTSQLHTAPSTVASIASPTSLPYISLPFSRDHGLVLTPSSQRAGLPVAGYDTAESRGTDSMNSVMPHPPLRSRATSAGTSRPRPSSAGKERTGLPVSRGGWMSGDGAQDLEQRLLHMGDELSRLASYEQECHRKDGVISTLRDEVSDLKAALSENQLGFRGGGSGSAFSSTAIVAELRDQNSQLQSLLREKEENERTVSQKLAMYQNQLHVKNEEVASLKEQLHSQQRSSTAWVKAEPNASTNTIASLRTEIAEKDRKISLLENELEKANKHKMQTTTLMNSLQRENSAKDTLVHQAKNEVNKLKKELREKDASISSLSAKMTRQKAAKEAEHEVEKKERELIALKGKLQSAEKQLKERNKVVVELENELDKTRHHMASGQQVADRALQQELNHAKAQCLDAQRAEKLLKVDYQHLDKRFDRFRRKVIQNTFSGGFSRSTDQELEDEELLDYVKELAQERDALVKEIKEYAAGESKKDETIKELQDAASGLKKYIDRMERHLVKSGRSCKALEEELNQVEELIVHDSVTWVKEALCKIVTNELAWQQKTEEALLNAGIESEGEESTLNVKELCEQLKKQREETRRLQGKVSEMEETHQESLIKLREDLKREEEKNIRRAVGQAREEEEERRHEMMQEQRVKERDRIQAAIEAEKRVLESQHGSVTQLQKALEDKQRELENYKSALSSAKAQYQQTREALQRSKEAENELKNELRGKTSVYQTQLARLEQEKDELRIYKQDEVQSFKEQTRQHAVTIVAMEDRLMKITKHNKQLELELNYAKQQLGGKHFRPPSPRKDHTRPSSPKKESSPRPQTPKKEPRPQTRSVETETAPQSNLEAALQSDIYKLEQLVLLLRREAAQAKKEAEGQNDVVQALRRDLAGASARMSDMAGELSDKQKQRLEEYAEKIRLQDDELAAQRKQLVQLSALVDEQRKEIDSREDILTKQEKVLLKQKQNMHKKGNELVEFKEKIASELEEQKTQLERIEQEGKATGELHTQGARCRGERHEMVIARQKEALAELRLKMKGLEQLKPPFPSHEQALQQVVNLKKELSEARAQLAAREEDFHKNESELHVEVRRQREMASSTSAESNIEKSAHRETKEALDMSEKTYLKIVRTLAAILEFDSIPGCRSMAHLPAEERDKLEQERNKATEQLVSKVKQLHDRIGRQNKMLTGYETDLAQLSASETVAGQKTAEATGLKMDVRNRQEEIAYLRGSLSRLREELDQQRRLNVSLKQRKRFAMDMDERDHRNHNTGHSCYVDEYTRYKEEVKNKKMSEKLKRKNYEIESLKKELRTADKELNETAAKLLSFETSGALRDSYANNSEAGESISLEFEM